MSTYWLMVGIGALAMLTYTLRQKKTVGLTILQCILFSLLLTLCGIGGAKLLYVLENLQEPLSATLLSGGVSFFGSVYLIPLVMPLLGRLFRLNDTQTLDLCGPCVAVMIGFIRVGCFLNGCCGGQNVWLSNYHWIWPTQAMESIGDFIIFAKLAQYAQRQKYPGLLYPLFMLSYSSLRFFVEFLRNTPRPWFGLSHGHRFSLIALLAALIWIWISRNRRTAK